MNTIQGAMTTIEYDEDFKRQRVLLLCRLLQSLDDLEEVRQELFMRTEGEGA